MHTRAIVLAAGQGKRMRSTKPKVLHDILGKTILWRVLNAIDQLNLEHIHIVLGHEAKTIQEYLNTCSLKTPISCHIQEPQLGTGHAVRQVEPALKNFKGNLLVTAGDTPLLTSKTLQGLLEAHASNNADFSLLTTIVEDAKNYGRILRSKNGDVTGIIEDKDATPEQKLIKEINPAIYCLKYPDIKEGLASLTNKNKQGEYYLTDLVGWACNKKLKVNSFVCQDWQELIGINSRIDLAEAGKLLNNRVLQTLALESGATIIDPQSTFISPEVKIEQDVTVLPGCWLIGDITIGSGCVIGPATSITGKVKIGSGSQIFHSYLTDCQVGNNCRVGPFAHLREGVLLANQVRVGNFVELKKSTVGANTNVAHLSYVGDTTIGSEVNIGAGTITANYDHITKVKSRTEIGDGVSTGSNSVLVAPISIGNEAVIAAGTVVTKNVPNGALAVGRTKQENREGWSEARRKKAKK